MRLHRTLLQRASAAAVSVRHGPSRAGQHQGGKLPERVWIGIERGCGADGLSDMRHAGSPVHRADGCGRHEIGAERDSAVGVVAFL